MYWLKPVVQLGLSFEQSSCQAILYDQQAKVYLAKQIFPLKNGLPAPGEMKPWISSVCSGAVLNVLIVLADDSLQTHRFSLREPPDEKAIAAHLEVYAEDYFPLLKKQACMRVMYLKEEAGEYLHQAFALEKRNIEQYQRLVKQLPRAYLARVEPVMSALYFVGQHFISSTNYLLFYFSKHFLYALRVEGDSILAMESLPCLNKDFSSSLVQLCHLLPIESTGLFYLSEFEASNVIIELLKKATPVGFSSLSEALLNATN